MGCPIRRSGSSIGAAIATRTSVTVGLTARVSSEGAFALQMATEQITKMVIRSVEFMLPSPKASLWVTKQVLLEIDTLVVALPRNNRLPLEPTWRELILLLERELGVPVFVGVKREVLIASTDDAFSTGIWGTRTTLYLRVAYVALGYEELDLARQFLSLAASLGAPDATLPSDAVETGSTSDPCVAAIAARELGGRGSRREAAAASSTPAQKTKGDPLALPSGQGAVMAPLTAGAPAMRPGTATERRPSWQRLLRPRRRRNDR